MNRRKFIGISILSMIGITVTSIFVFNDFETVVLKILKQDLKALNIQEKHFKRFIADAQNSSYVSKVMFDKKKKVFISIFHILPKVGLPGESKYSELRQRIVSDFLLSTDFFVNGMDPTKDVKYVGLFDPYLRPCQNPFSPQNYPAKS
jgi:hypothetical protein